MKVSCSDWLHRSIRLVQQLQQLWLQSQHLPGSLLTQQHSKPRAVVGFAVAMNG
jgi:hypothetical protein